MSYLSALRFHFAGGFVADVPTMNNEVENFRQLKRGDPIDNVGFNPGGSGEFQLEGCTVRSAFYRDGTPVEQGKDSVIGLHVADADARVAAKIVDLDVEQTNVPTIYGLQIRLVDNLGKTVLRGEFEPAAASDYWTRCPQLGYNTYGEAASYQSVITGLKWEDSVIDDEDQTLASSSFLYQLYELAPDDSRLSIKFNLDAFRTQNRGRIVGTIGPVENGDPLHFVRGRHFFARVTADGDPEHSLYHAVAVLDPTLSRIRVDLGNALPTAGDTKLLDLGTMILECARLDAGGNFQERICLGTIDYLGKTDPKLGNPLWYTTFAGIADLPVAKDVFEIIDEHPLGITLPDKSEWPALVLRETPKGLFIRSETSSCRLQPANEPFERETIRFHATCYGKPLANARVLLFFDPTVEASDAGLEFEPVIRTDDEGLATVHLQAKDTDQRRDFTDSYLYQMRYALEETLSPSLRYPFNLSDVISVIVWETFEQEKPATTWVGTVQPIFEKYAVLFPVMKRFLDLSSYDEVCSYCKKLIFALSLPAENPNHMPVSRDLSPAKRQAILDWLKRPDEKGRPLRG